MKFLKVIFIITFPVIIFTTFWNQKWLINDSVNVILRSLGAGPVNIIPPKTNTLAVDTNQSTTVNVSINQPVEFDFLTKDEVLQMRAKEVRKHPSFIEGEYIPSSHLFGQITDKKPWWGLEGQYCKGDGKESIEGMSEESRFLLNPFLLIGVNELNAYKITNRPCKAIYITPIKLIWDINNKTATIIYNYTEFLSQKRIYGFDTNEIIFLLEDYNARDFGFRYFYSSGEKTQNIKGVDDSKLLRDITEMKNFIHLGQSCGYPGGCNNASPYDPEVLFTISKTPATLYLKLWEKLPENKTEIADFIFIIKFI